MKNSSVTCWWAKVNEAQLGWKHSVCGAPWAARLCCTYPQRGEWLKGGYFVLGQEGPSKWKCFRCIPNSVAEVLTSQNSPLPKLLYPLQSNWRVTGSLGKAWKISQPKATPMLEDRSGADSHPGMSGRQWKDWTLGKNLSCLSFFLEQEKMSCPRFEFTYCSECGFNLIWFKQGLASQAPKYL